MWTKIKRVYFARAGGGCRTTMVHDEMVIQLIVDRSSSNMETRKIAGIYVSSALVCGVVRRRERQCCVQGKCRMVPATSSSSSLMAKNCGKSISFSTPGNESLLHPPKRFNIKESKRSWSG